MDKTDTHIVALDGQACQRRVGGRELVSKVREWMTSDVVSVAPGLTLRSAAELLATRHIGGAPVVAGSR